MNTLLHHARLRCDAYCLTDSYHRDNHAIRHGQYRCIRYADGGEVSSKGTLK